MKPIRPIHDKKISNHERVLDRMHDILDGNVDLGGLPSLGATAQDQGNASVAHVAATAPVAPNTEFAVTHNLGRIPRCFTVTQVDRAARFYGSGTAWTTTQIFLKCDTASALANFMIW